MNPIQILKAWGKFTLQELEIIERDPEGARRLSICVKCPGNHLTERKTCELCGCYMESKVLLRDAKCDKGFWNDNNK